MKETLYYLSVKYQNYVITVFNNISRYLDLLIMDYNNFPFLVNKIYSSLIKLSSEKMASFLDLHISIDNLRKSYDFDINIVNELF